MEEKKIYYKVIEIMPMESGTSQTTGKECKAARKIGCNGI